MTLRVLVFGKTGQVARAIQGLAGPKLKVTALSREQADFTAPDQCAEMVFHAEADAVINAAGFNAVDKAETEPETAQMVNADTPGVIAQACADRGLPFIHISSDYVFDGAKDASWREDDPTHPLNVYGQTKLSGERAVREAGGDHVILRTSWVFSAQGQNFVKTMLRLHRAGQSLRVVSDQFGGPTEAGSIASAIITIAESLAAGRGVSGTFHFCGAPATSWHGFAEEIIRHISGSSSQAIEPLASTDWPTPAARPRNSVLDCTKILEIYGVKQPDWRVSLASMLDDLGNRGHS